MLRQRASCRCNRGDGASRLLRRLRGLLQDEGRHEGAVDVGLLGRRQVLEAGDALLAVGRPTDAVERRRHVPFGRVVVELGRTGGPSGGGSCGSRHTDTRYVTVIGSPALICLMATMRTRPYSTWALQLGSQEWLQKMSGPAHSMCCPSSSCSVYLSGSDLTSPTSSNTVVPVFSAATAATNFPDESCRNVNSCGSGRTPSEATIDGAGASANNDMAVSSNDPY